MSYHAVSMTVHTFVPGRVPWAQEGAVPQPRPRQCSPTRNQGMLSQPMDWLAVVDARLLAARLSKRMEHHRLLNHIVGLSRAPLTHDAHPK
jgi:hypothetical protein